MINVNVSAAVKEAHTANLTPRVTSLIEGLNSLKKESTTAQSKDIMQEINSLKPTKLGDKEVFTLEFTGADVNVLRVGIDTLKNQGDKRVIFVVNENEGKLIFLRGVTKDLNPGVKAGDLVKIAAVISGGGGGGRPDFAQAGGKDLSKKDEALAAVMKELEK